MHPLIHASIHPVMCLFVLLFRCICSLFTSFNDVCTVLARLFDLVMNLFFCSYCHLTVYAPDMPNRLPVKDFVGGLVTNILRALKYWLHYTLVALAWLGVVPITACKWKFTLLHFPLIFKLSVVPRCMYL